MNADKPHDKFFKETFSRTDITSDFLQAYLPEALLRRLDLTSLRREVDSYADEQLSEHFADLVFSATVDGQAVKITLLLEHKSYAVKHPHFQVNRYMLNVWEQQLRQATDLTPILPIVIYHGQSRWQKRPLSAYFSPLAKELNPYLPDFDYVLIDLNTIETQLNQLHSDYARLTGLLLQFSRQKRMLLRVLDDHAQLVRNLVETGDGRSFVATTFIYLNWASRLTAVEVMTIFEHISTKAAEVAMSAAQTWINEGLAKGIQQGFERGVEQGVEQGIERSVRGMMKLGIDADTIAKALDMSRTDTDRLIEKLNKKKK